MTMATTAERMGVEGGDGYGERIDDAMKLVRASAFTRDERLCLAWALVDSAGSSRTVPQSVEAMTAIEALWEAEEGSE
jgi:hypothetical protein